MTARQQSWHITFVVCESLDTNITRDDPVCFIAHFFYFIAVIHGQTIAAVNVYQYLQNELNVQRLNNDGKVMMHHEGIHVVKIVLL